MKKVDWMGLLHEKVSEKFDPEGKQNLKFVNYINVGKNGDLVAAVYHTSNPDTSKGHKEFMLIWKMYTADMSDGQLVVSGMTREQIEEHVTVKGIACWGCDTAMYSLNRHHFHGCSCENETFVDGGKDYLRAGAVDLGKTNTVTINLLTDEIHIDTRPTRR